MKKIFILLLIIGLVVLFYVFDLDQSLTFENIKKNQSLFNQHYQSQPLKTLGLFFLGYVLLTGLSLPGAAILTLLAGALFGLVTGTILVSLASTIGSCLSFLLSRFLAKDWLQKKYSSQLKVFNEGVNKEGSFYLFTLRLIPIFPFFLINIIMGLTPMKLKSYFAVSWLGMLPGTFVFILAGTQLATINSPKEILSPKILLCFFAIGVLPFIAKKAIAFMSKP